MLLQRCVIAPRWEDGRPAKVEAATCNGDLRQSYGLGNPIKDAEIGRVVLRNRRVVAVNAIKSEARLVDHGSAEGVCLIQRE